MKKIQYFVLLLILCSCSNQETSQVTTQIIPELVFKGNLYGDGNETIEAQKTVIDNQENFTLLQHKMQLVNNSLNPPIVTVHFETHQIIAVFDGLRTSGGHEINITNVLETETQIIVSTTTNSPNDVAITIISQPYHIVKIPRSSKPIIFI